jgi:hypothetical protein
MKRVGESAIRQGTRKRRSGGNLLRREPQENEYVAGIAFGGNRRIQRMKKFGEPAIRQGTQKKRKWRELPSEGTAEEIKFLNEQ